MHDGLRAISLSLAVMGLDTAVLKFSGDNLKGDAKKAEPQVSELNLNRNPLSIAVLW